MVYALFATQLIMAHMVRHAALVAILCIMPAVGRACVWEGMQERQCGQVPPIPATPANAPLHISHIPLHLTPSSSSLLLPRRSTPQAKEPFTPFLWPMVTLAIGYANARLRLGHEVLVCGALTAVVGAAYVHYVASVIQQVGVRCGARAMRSCFASTEWPL